MIWPSIEHRFEHVQYVVTLRWLYRICCRISQWILKRISSSFSAHDSGYCGPHDCLETLKTVANHQASSTTSLLRLPSRTTQHHTEIHSASHTNGRLEKSIDIYLKLSFIEVRHQHANVSRRCQPIGRVMSLVVSFQCPTQLEVTVSEWLSLGGW